MNSCSDLDLDLIMPNIELVRAIFIYYNVLKFHVPRLIFYELSCKNTDTCKHTHTDAHTDSDEYSIGLVGFNLQKRNYNKLSVPKLRSHTPKMDTSHFTKSLKCDNIDNIYGR